MFCICVYWSLLYRQVTTWLSGPVSHQLQWREFNNVNCTDSLHELHYSEIYVVLTHIYRNNDYHEMTLVTLWATIWHTKSEFVPKATLNRFLGWRNDQCANCRADGTKKLPFLFYFVQSFWHAGIFIIFDWATAPKRLKINLTSKNQQSIGLVELKKTSISVLFCTILPTRGHFHYFWLSDCSKKA